MSKLEDDVAKLLGGFVWRPAYLRPCKQSQQIKRSQWGDYQMKRSYWRKLLKDILKKG